MIDIKSYILLEKKDRQKHLKLDEDCLERGGQSMYLKGLLAHLHNTTIPSGKKIHVCHACHNAKCSNPNHIYWGTASENSLDRMANGGLNVWEKMVDKYGLAEAKRMQASGNKAASGRGNKGKPKSAEHKKNIAEAITKKHLTNKITWPEDLNDIVCGFPSPFFPNHTDLVMLKVIKGSVDNRFFILAAKDVICDMGDATDWRQHIVDIQMNGHRLTVLLAVEENELGKDEVWRVDILNII